ncbi:NADH:ubiquinone oxidoreductase [Ophidiomyces ophidiicola]|uniref:NADH:ubiquinone oxidoreductase n=1 Tax=Ophidiomyces ophidiicola TaxID=1387563 RepID=A0ACB8V0A4_9EURO|nr:NADH:ubiquinone oxidoreductase [Ophidiomyces ophidiicola]KAI1919397.1 NADH:ubiquinone oxidoreductase [Ophidiomyces ophidiicola]KAI1928371.1 NADH:ubiquinone oxidoreductase [Ophidiomyces ophidiicola]KAI1953625.1 NADH:ubiquinone oxidoreductase [Ophidiomyces ophidiicola]KAI1968467.1 NADH:ubiquinone oxidoreductase [Ophidiomyces ophidiicola]
MPDESISSLPDDSKSPNDAIAYYKAQYEQLEVELAEFQTSSRELEAELEKDIEASEKRERKLKEKAESLGFEVEEWKTKYKQAKSEANSAQNTLQREVTTLREANRTLQLKLRDIEVVNDDFERQARHTTSSLEDLESKYNVAIERGVLLEEEIKHGEKERESLRIDAQRLRDELSDLKVETHIAQEKLRKAESTVRRRNRDFSISSTTSNIYAERSPTTTATTTASSPSITTPITKSISSVNSDDVTPPSPPCSEQSTSIYKTPATPTLTCPRTSISELKSFQKFSPQSRGPRHSRGPSAPAQNGRNTPNLYYRRSSTATTSSNNSLPRSGSLYQIRGLIGKMQKLEERVHSARSRLPAPAGTPPKVSPRASTILGQTYLPSTVTMRNARKRVSGGITSFRDGEVTPSRVPQSRTSFSIPQSAPPRSRPIDSRPSSRASVSSRYSTSQNSGPIPFRRPESRQSFSRASVTSHSTTDAESRRPRSSLSNYNPSTNMSYIHEHEADVSTPTPRPTVLTGREFPASGIPTAPGIKKRQSAGSTAAILAHGRRISQSLSRREGEMLLPDRTAEVSELGETY